MIKKLFTPGPLTTSNKVKNAALQDLGSRDSHFISTVDSIRKKLLYLADASEQKYTAILMQGSGTFGVESMISTIVPEHGRLLILINGAYGKRIKEMAIVHKLKFNVLEWPENTVIDHNKVARHLALSKDITDVVMVHCETTTGILNPVNEVAKVVAKAGCDFHLDAMSSFGGVPLSLTETPVDFLVSSSNKCIQGIPGFSFVIADKEKLKESAGNQRSLSLDLLAQWEGLEKNGQFRFTPPVQSLLAFEKALIELEEEGGIEKRNTRYASNNKIIQEGMAQMGFKSYVPQSLQSPIISTFYYPTDENFNFNLFYNLLSEKGSVIYPGKLTKADCFRIGNIGDLHAEDMYTLLHDIKKTLTEMEIILIDKVEAVNE